MNDTNWNNLPNEDTDLDELLRSSREVLDEDASDTEPDVRTPLGDADTYDAQDELVPFVQNSSPVDDFEPDFGNAFGDYGVYEGDEPENEEETVSKPKKRRWHLKRFRFPTIVKVAIYLVVLVGIGILAAKLAWRYADDVLALTRPDEPIEVRINDTDNLDDIARTLKDAGAIEYEWLFKLYCKFSKSEHYFDPGVYMIKGSYDYHALVNNLMASAGNRETTRIMIIEGAECSEIFDLLEKENVCTRAKLEEAAAEYEFDYAFLTGIPYGDANRLEGYLFPDTYDFYLNDDPVNVLEKFLDNFEHRVDEDLIAKITETGYTLHEIINVASMIEAEAANDGERGDVASVIYNRLKNWEVPKLGMDSTVFYAAEMEGTTFSLEINSPYNTYMYPGLPKGPVCNPGLNSIKAAITPNQTNYYYFATAKDGLNRFFSSEDPFIAFINSDDYIGN